MKKYGFVLILSLLLSLPFSVFTSCHFFESFDETEEDNTTLTFDKDNLNLLTGSMDTLKLSVSDNQNGAGISWTYDSNIIKAVTDNYGVVLTGLSAGQTEIRATYNNNGSYASCLVTVSGESYRPVITNPYVYASRDYVSLSPKEKVRISAALFGGNPSDVSGFNWSLDRTDVASISTEGNYCWITGLANGTAKLTLRHPKATYAYSVLLDVSGGEYNEPYITTTNNIVTIDLNNSNKTESAIAVKLMNSVLPQNEKFRFNLVDENGNDIAGSNNCPVSITETAGNLCQIAASKAGDCILRATHEQSKYPLDILIRVLEKTDGSYIELTQPIVTVSGSNGGEIKAFIADTDEPYDPSLFTWDFSSEASLYSSWTIYNGNGINSGDRIVFSGTHTGSFRVKVNYPGMNERSAVIVVRDLEAESSKATTTITTSQSFVSLTENEEVQINILLSDCAGGDINDLLWSIVNNADDGSSSPVITWLSGNGKSVSRSASGRSATKATYSEYAYCRIKGLKPGSATIEISHPKALYSTKIDIKVKSPKAEEPKKSYLSYSSSPLIILKNNSEYTAVVNLSGEGEKSDIEWSISDSNLPITLLPLADGSCVIKGPVDENTEPLMCNVLVNHPNCSKGISFTVYTLRPTDENITIPEVPSFYTTEDLFRKTEIGYFLNFTVTTSSIDTPHIIWHSSRESVVSIDSAEGNFCRVQAEAPGTSVVSASIDGFPSIEFVVKVTDPRVVSEDADIYLFSSTRALFFENENDSAKNFTINIAGMNDIESYLHYELSDPSAYSVSYNGSSVSVMPLKSNTEAYITVTNPYSLNSLIINLRTGKLYEYKNEDQAYIELSKNVVQLYKGQKEETVTARIVHTSAEPSNNDEKNFNFSSSDPSVAEISFVQGTNSVFILPKNEGKAVIYVHHSDAKYDSEIQVIVNRPGDTNGIPYLTSDLNVITVIEGEIEPVSVSIQNLNSADASQNYKFSWRAVGNDGFVEPVAQNGMTCMISGNKPGTQKVRVTHEDCLFPFEFTVICIDDAIAEQKPFIKTDRNIVTLKKGESTTLSAELKGGTSEAADNQFFTWASSSNTSILINPTGSTCYIKGIDTGMTRISVRNNRYPSSYTKEILVIVEEPGIDDCYIRVSDTFLRMKPDSTSFYKVTAELVNGSPVDAADFIWWCDDYGLVMTNSIAGECSITPKGQSGTTKLHIKHPKSSKTVDILISVSEYQNFAFSQQNMTLRAGKIYFIPMQVPAQENEYKISYVSSDTDIMYAAGSKQTAFVAPRHSGNVFLTANMTTPEGEIIATAESLITIEEDDIRIPDISAGSSIIQNMEEGQDLILSAIISGGNVSEGEKYNLKWQVISGPEGGLIFKNGAADGTYTGCDALISCIKGDEEYVINISHEATGAVTQLWIKTVKLGEKRIELSSYYEAAYKSDGSFKITASVVNGKNGEQKNIEWTAVKNGGQNIVSVPKTAGPVCTITPKAEGMTTITARLPDGTYAECQVIILADAIIKLATSNVHVMPGEVTAVSYYTEPANCTIQWYEEMTGSGSSWGSAPEQYFSYTVNENEKKIYITGLKEVSGGPAGTLKGIMTSSKCNTTPVLNVFCEYYCEMSVTDTQGSFLSNVTLLDEGDDKVFDKGFTFLVNYSPKEMDIDVKSNDVNVVKPTVSKQIITNDVGKEIMQATVHLSVVKEGSTEINIVTQLNKEGLVNEVKKSRSITYNGYYKDYTIEFEPDSNAIAGAFSKYENGNIYLADGEEILISAKILNKYAAGEITDIVYTPNNMNDVEFNNGSSVYTDKNRNEVRNNIWGNDLNSYRNLYGSDDTVKPNPGKSLISMKAEDVQGTTKKLFRLKHCFDYYKDISGAGSLLNGGYHQYKNYIEGDDIYYLITKDMFWNISCDQGQFTWSTGGKYNNNAIAYWVVLNESDNAYTNDDLAIIKPIFKTNVTRKKAMKRYSYLHGHTSKYEKQAASGDGYTTNYYYSYTNINRYTTSSYNGEFDINNTYYYALSYCGLAVSGQDENRLNKYAMELATQPGRADDFIQYYGDNNDVYHKQGTVTENIGIHNTGYTPSGYADSWSAWYVDKNTTYKGSVSYTMDTYYPLLDRTYSLKYPTENNHSSYPQWDGNSCIGYDYGYVSYVNTEPYVVKRESIINNPNYVIPYAHLEDSDYYGTFNNNNDDCTVTILPTLMHEYCEPTICPYSHIYNGYNGKYIGNISIQYKIKSSSINNYYYKSIPIYFTAYKCEAYKKK